MKNGLKLKKKLILILIIKIIYLLIDIKHDSQI